MCPSAVPGPARKTAVAPHAGALYYGRLPPVAAARHPWGIERRITRERRSLRGRSEVGRCRSHRVGAQDLQEEGAARRRAAGSAAQAALREAQRGPAAESCGGSKAQAFPQLTRRHSRRPGQPRAGRSLLWISRHARCTRDACQRGRVPTTYAVPRPLPSVPPTTRALGTACRSRSRTRSPAATIRPGL